MTIINILITKEQDQWIAIGLEHFIAGQGASPLEAIRDLKQQFEGQEIFDRSHNQQPFALVPRAPESYFERFANAPLRLTWQSTEPTSPYEGELRMAE